MAGVSDATELFYAQQRCEQCAMGHHAWVPWIERDHGLMVTWCCRPHCDAREVYEPQTYVTADGRVESV